ncbi:phosphoribosylanthranilate isomerase [Cohnella cholangitidis]|uniref:N-(5'-phosphoribosyl)anthranilate isomerase n=1 Tax=Cohnella cholangitidis TaxID=2598458 RepID=A0A7G5C5A4_9BACL|nr:phosphoribosylanthranilate isomerase [Cohnella cholangitidis]QMV44388.1 phosphoribosylanthranilate isomerase [Cohnella cholangitidis]
MANSVSGSSMVKICGIKQEDTLIGMSGLSVEYIGFVFAKSRRQVSPERAAELLAVARQTPMANGKPPRAVGVFVDPTMEQLAETLSIVPLDVVQLHGDETPEFCRRAGERFEVEVWRALPVTEEDGDPIEGPARLDAYRGAVSTILLDTAGGGTGKAFRWEVIPAYQEAALRNGLQLFIAGGLSPDNADQLIKTYHPVGVDISSGVETDGVKDQHKIAAFVERVKSS